MMMLLAESRGVFAYRVFWEGFWRAYGAACIVEVEARAASLWCSIPVPNRFWELASQKVEDKL